MTSPAADESVLLALARLFAEHGFHSVSIEQLEAAAALPFEQLTERYGDKEAQFYASLDACRARVAAGSSDASIETLLRDLSAMLPAVHKASLNTKLRAVHREARLRLQDISNSIGGSGD